MDAAKDLDVEKVKALLAAGADPNAGDGMNTPLTLMAGKDSDAALEILQLLIAAGADVNARIHSLKGNAVATALMAAAELGYIDVVRLLIASGADVNAQPSFGTALVRAAMEGQTEVIQVLLDAGADSTLGVPDKPDSTPLARARAKGHKRAVEILERVLAKGQGKLQKKPKARTLSIPDESSSLMDAAKDLDVEKVKALLAAGADPNAGDGMNTPLTLMAGKDSDAALEILELLIAAGADVNARIHSLKGNAVATALMAAAELGYIDVVRLLIKSGADVNAQPSFGTALVRAAMDGQTEVIQVLLEAGADPTLGMPGEANTTPLELARAEGHKRAVGILEKALAKGQGKPHKEPKARTLSIPDGWSALEAALHKRTLGTLRNVVSARDIQALATTIGSAVPAELAALLKRHDGQKDAKEAYFISTGKTFDAPFRLLSAKEIVREWNLWNGLLAKGEFKKSRPRPGAGVTRAWFSPQWIPLTTDGLGNNHCLDLAPAQGGKGGQIILLWHDDAARPVVADSLAQWLAEISQTLAA